MFITVFTKARYWTLPLAPFSFKFPLNIILISTFMSVEWSLTLQVSYQNYTFISSFPLRAACRP